LDPKLLLEFGGGGGLDVLEGQIEPGSWTTFLLRAPAIGARYLAENLSLNRRLDEFERNFAEERARFEALDLGRASLRELGATLAGMEALLDRTGAVMLTCASGSLSSIVALRGLLRLVCKDDDATRLERELL